MVHVIVVVVAFTATTLTAEITGADSEVVKVKFPEVAVADAEFAEVTSKS